jgi:PAS domain S-box-containing protein
MDRPSILIVADDTCLSEEISGRLQKLGYEIAGIVTTGEKSIEIACRIKPSLVLMDMHLSKAMDGIHAMDGIRKSCPMPVIFLIANSDNPGLQCDLNQDVFGYILKPFDDRELHLQIEMALYRHTTEQKLRESQERLSVFAAATFEGIAEIEAGKVVDCNEQLAQMLGYSQEELKGMPVEHLIAPEDLERVNTDIRHEKEPIGDHVMLRKDGKRIFVEAHIRPLTPGRRYAAVRDVTGRKHLELNLKKLNRTLRALNHSNAARIRATDESAYLQEVCRNVVEDCGHAMAWIGFAEDDAERSVRPVASAGLKDGYLETLNITYADTKRGRGPTGRAIRTGRTSYCRNMHTDPRFAPWRREAIRLGYASSIALPLMSDGRCFGALNLYSTIPDAFCKEEVRLLRELADDLSFGISSLRLRTERDLAVQALEKAHHILESRIQERTADLRNANALLRVEIQQRERIEKSLRQSEQQLFASFSMLNRIIDGITDPLVVLDADLRVIRLNKAAKDYYGIERYQDAVGKLCYEAFRGRSSPCEPCDRPFSQMAGYSGCYERKGIKNPDSVEQVFVYQVRDESGALEASIFRVHDITQARMIERQLIQSEKLASLGLLVAGVTHEINNPNNFIFFNIPILRSYIQFLLSFSDEYVATHPDLMVFGKPYADFRQDCFRLLDNVAHGSTRINQIVGNLREFVRERGKNQMRPIDLKQVIEKAISICLDRIRKTVNTFETKFLKVPPKLYTDPLALEQILVNLLINAAQASDKADSWVELSVTVQEEPENLVVVEIRDNGCGMDRETQLKIFDPFFTTKAAGVGTGLGLFITHRLVEELGGYIEVQSELGKGSVFRVMLKIGHPDFLRTSNR